MSKRFAALLANCSKEEEDAVTQYVKNKFGWWHWLPNVWLISTSTDLTARKLRDDLQQIVPKKHMLILELSDTGHDTWSGFGPATDEQNMFAWIRKYWGDV